MMVAIGSTRLPKVNAVKSVFEKLAPELGFDAGAIRYQALSVDSGIASMPMTIEELMQGARNRARNVHHALQKQHLEPDFSVGLEGGFFCEIFDTGETVYFLQSWVYVMQGEYGFFGSSAAVPVPEKIIREMKEREVELGLIIDNYGAQSNIRDKGGAFEIFTRGHINRQQSYEMALICAMAPYYHKTLYFG